MKKIPEPDSYIEGIFSSENDYTLTLILPKKSMKWLKHFQDALESVCTIECVLDAHKVDMFEIKRHIPWKISASTAENLVKGMMTIGLGDGGSLPEQCVGKLMKLSFRMLVPSKFAYRIIGVRGRTVATMREQLNCDVFITEIPLAENKILCLVANTSEQEYLRTALYLVAFASTLFKSSANREEVLECAATYLTNPEMGVLKVMVESRQEQEMELQGTRLERKKIVRYQKKDQIRHADDTFANSSQGSRKSFTMQHRHHYAHAPMSAMQSMEKDFVDRTFGMGGRASMATLDSQGFYQYDPAMEHHRQYFASKSYDEFNGNMTPFNVSKPGSFDLYYGPPGKSIEAMTGLLRNPSEEIMPSGEDSSAERLKQRYSVDQDASDNNVEVFARNNKHYGRPLMSNMPSMPFDLINSISEV